VTRRNPIRPQPNNRAVVLATPYGIENRGIRYIASTLRARGFEPHLVLLKRWVNNDLQPPTDVEEELFINLIKEINPLFVGIGFGAPYFPMVTGLTIRLRAATPVPVLWGGVHPTVCPEDCIEHVDFVCVGEGEECTAELAEALQGKGEIENVAGLWLHRNGKVVQTAPRPLLQDLDSLPFPQQMHPDTWFVEDNKLRRADPLAGTVEYRIYPTRGCPYKCTYCHAHVLRKVVAGTPGKFYRYRSVENVLAELENALNELPRIRRVKFDGDVFAFPKKWIEEFAAAYRERINIPFELLTYPGELDQDDLRLLKGAGLRKVQTGIQSGSDRELLESYGRRSKTADIVELSRFVAEIGVEVAFDLIFDNPLASTADKRSVVELLLRLHHPFTVYLYSLTLFPKTKLTDELLAAGKITPNDVEGRATKSLRQFRLSFDWPRSPEDRFWIALSVLAAKRFVPKPFIQHCLDNHWLQKHPAALERLAKTADLAKVGTIALRMLLDGELTVFKLRQYGSRRRVISQ
jgi:anaerobic magnesium-protoporphyrin IX monomethyl ester cyclase